MKAAEVHKMSAEELQVEETRLRQALYALKTKAVTDKVEKPHEFTVHKRDIARIQTERRVRQIKQERQA